MSGGIDLRVIAVGDLAVNGRFQSLLESEGYDFPLRSVSSSWKGADLRLGNLESPAGTGPRAAPSKMTLRGASGTVALLRAAGFDFVSLANNHMMDYGPEGIVETHAALDAGGILHGGSGLNESKARGAVCLEQDGQRIGILSYCEVEQKSPLYATGDAPGVAAVNKEQCIAEIRQLRSWVDWVILQLHWGLEMAYLPSPSQRELARKFVEAGADLILGHHAHLLQPMEIIGNAPVFYCLGNFLFSEMYWRGRDADGGEFLSKLRLHPLSRRTAWIEVRLMKGKPAETILHPVRLTRRLDIAPDETPERYAEWDGLCRVLNAPNYERAYAAEVARAQERARWRWDWSSVPRRVELKLFQWGLIPFAVEGD